MTTEFKLKNNDFILDSRAIRRTAYFHTFVNRATLYIDLFEKKSTILLREAMIAACLGVSLCVWSGYLTWNRQNLTLAWSLLVVALILGLLLKSYLNSMQELIKRHELFKKWYKNRKHHIPVRLT